MTRAKLHTIGALAGSGCLIVTSLLLRQGVFNGFTVLVLAVGCLLLIVSLPKVF